MVHWHPSKAGSETDQPEGSIIKCFDSKAKAVAMHVAILISQKKEFSSFAEISVSWNQSFKEMIEYFQGKGYEISEKSWRDVWKNANARAFTVAQVASMDVLVEIREKLDAAFESGQTLQQFKDSLWPELAKSGWLVPEGEQAIELLPDGTTRKRLTGARLDTIYRTNLGSATAVGRYEQMQATAKTRPYWKYVATIDPSTRPEHARLDGTIRPAGDKFWDKFYPPNGFNCRCRVQSLREKDMDRKGLKITSIPKGVEPDEGFDYNPGAAGFNSWEPDLSEYPKELVKSYQAERR